MTSAVQSLPSGSPQTKPLWAAVTVLGVAVLALGAGLIHVQTRPLDGQAVLATLDPSTLSALQPPVVIADSGPVASQAVNAPAPRVVCANCGRVEAVTPIQRKRSTQGIGAVGGGGAGNAIETNTRHQAIFQVLVRMDDGSLRRVEQASMPTVGAAVVVDGNALRERVGQADNAPAQSPPAPQAGI